MNNEIEQATLSSGALGSIGNPIKPNDPNTIRKHIDHKTDDDSKKIQDITDGSMEIEDSTDGSKEIQVTTSSSDPSQATQKLKIKWRGALENQFYKAIEHIGVHEATPKKILQFMNLKFLTKGHISSKLQKYRQTLKRVEEERMKKTRIDMYPEFSSAAGYTYPQHSYNYNTRLDNNNLFNVQPGYGLGQSSSMMNNNVGLHDSLNYMNRRPTYNLSHTGSKLFPRGGNLGFQNGMSPLKGEWRNIPQTSQAPMFGQYGIPSNVLGMNYNPTTGSGSLQGMSVHGNGHGSLGGIRGHGPGNGSLEGIRVHPTTGSGSLQGMNVHGNGHGSLGGIRGHGPGNGCLEGMRVHGNSNDSLGGIRVHGAGTGPVGGIRVHGTGTGSIGGINVHGTDNGNGSLGENFGMNWNFSNNNMTNHGSSASMFLDNKDQSQNNSIAQTNGVIPALENPKIFNDHHNINEFFSDTSNSQFHQNQHQGNMTGVNREASTAYPLEDTSSWSYNDGTSNEDLLTSLAANPKMNFPTQDMNITNQGTSIEDLLTSLAANSEMNFPTQDMNITNQGTSIEDLLTSLAANPEMNFPTQDVNITNQGTSIEDLLTPLAANPEMNFPTQDMNITNQGTSNEDLLTSLAANPEMNFPTQDMNITNQGNIEDILNSLDANPEMYFPTQDMNITNQDHEDDDFLNVLRSILT